MVRADQTDQPPAIGDFLQLLARAARQFRTYPATSTLCTEAIDACHAAFLALAHDDALVMRITSQQLLIGDQPVAIDVTVDHELRRPLHACRVTTVEFERGTASRDWTHFCAVLAVARRTPRDGPTFAERLMDAGVSCIVPRMTPRPEVVSIGDAPAAVRRVVAFERSRQAQAISTGPAQYLYPPDKGWVRLDPTSEDASISLIDLAVFVNDPARLAALLARLVDDAADGAAAVDPLRDRYDDVVMLINALEPRVARVLLTKLSHAVLDLDAERRRALLRRSILPHLLDGRVDGEAILTEFPDVELAEALGLLFDLEVASPQVLPLALDHLRMESDRRARMVPLIDAAVRGRPSRAADRWAAAGFDRQAEKLIHVESGTTKQFGDFAAFDLSIDDRTRAALADVPAVIAATDGTEAWLACVVRLARLEPNPLTVAALLGRAVPVVQAFVREERWADAVRWLGAIGNLAAEIESARPDVAAAARGVLARFCNRETVHKLATLCATDRGREYASLILAPLGRGFAAAWLDALASPADRAAAMKLRSVMCECAVHAAPAIAERLGGLPSEVAVAALAVLAFAGKGHEEAIAARVSDVDEALSREALRALARIASPKAGALIAAQIERGGKIQPAAEEALWRLPTAMAIAKARDLLCRREFVAHSPHAAARLLERVAHGGNAGLESVLGTLAPLRFHFWNPALARVGAKARGLM